ncbi:MAG TPA: hypothetical protein VGM63_18405 [Mucilaginibacter sp.]|jgi:hypothetical protein
MENNYSILNLIPAQSDREKQLAILFMQILEFTGLVELQPDSFDYLLAISG